MGGAVIGSQLPNVLTNLSTFFLHPGLNLPGFSKRKLKSSATPVRFPDGGVAPVLVIAEASLSSLILVY